MKEKKHYLSLKFKGGNTFHENGGFLKSAERIVNIGETVDCDVRYDSDGMSPEYYASIVRNDDGESWRIVRRSQYVDVSIIGKGPVDYARQLHDGDVVQFGSQPMSLLFQSHFDSHHDGAPKDNRYWLWPAAALAFMLVALSVVVMQRKVDGINEKDILPLEESVFLLKVDSVRKMLVAGEKMQQMCPTKVLDDEAPTGTAFLTTDGTIVTARHCVEYWLARNLDLTTKVDGLPENDMARWAIETETFNQNHPEPSDSAMLLQVHFSIYDFLGEKRHSFCSTDNRVHMNKDEDGIFLLADFSQECYWRSINPYFNNMKMAMGDILWIDGLEEKGTIKTSNSEDLRMMEQGTKLMTCGYPITGTGDKKATMASGIIKRDVTDDNVNLVFESNINHGFSGAPVFAKIGKEIVAVGVVSRVDSVSSGLYKWAVPVTAIRKDKGEEDDE